MFREVIDEAIIGAVCDVVKVLHADYLRNSLSLCELLRADVAQTQMTNKSLAFEFGQYGQRFFNGFLRWLNDSSNAEIDYVELV